MFSKSPLTSDAFMANPESVLGEWRREAALVQTKLPIIGNIWITTTQEAASLVLKDEDNFSMRKADGNVTGLQWWMPGAIKRLSSNMLASDEPDHRRLRSTVEGAFARADILGLEGRIREIADGLADRIFENGRRADLVTGFARPFPLAVICELLGLPEEDRPWFTKWAQGLTKVEGLWSFLFALRGISKMTGYLQKRIEIIRRDGGSGLIAELVGNELGSDALNADELLSMVFLLLIAGHETTTHLISGGMWSLLAHHDQLAKLKSDRDLYALTVEECLRFVSPVQMSKPRHVRKDIEICGVQLKRGDVVMASLTAANMDPAIFDAPEKFDISRRPNPHLSFGSGIHFCLGHQLARLEGRVAFETLLERFPNLQLAAPDAPPKWGSRLGLRALTKLEVSAG